MLIVFHVRYCTLCLLHCCQCVFSSLLISQCTVCFLPFFSLSFFFGCCYFSLVRVASAQFVAFFDFLSHVSCWFCFDWIACTCVWRVQNRPCFFFHSSVYKWKKNSLFSPFFPKKNTMKKSRRKHTHDGHNVSKTVGTELMRIECALSNRFVAFVSKSLRFRVNLSVLCFRFFFSSSFPMYSILFCLISWEERAHAKFHINIKQK